MANYKGLEDLVNGSNFNLYLYDGTAESGITSATPIAYGTSCGIDISSDQITANNKFSCRWADNLAGSASYTINSDSLYTHVSGMTSFGTLMEIMTAADPEEQIVYWAMGPEKAWTGTCETNTHELDTDAVYYYGKGLITSLSMEAAVDDVCSCSTTITGSGAIYKAN